MKLMFNGEELLGGGGISMDQVNAAIDEKLKNVKAEDVYSTEETRIGTWIDGKPLYRKCFSFPYSDSTLNTYKTVAKVEEPIDIAAHIFGTRLNAAKACYSIPNIAIMIRITPDGEIQIHQSSTGWSGTYYITVEYTKNTD